MIPSSPLAPGNAGKLWEKEYFPGLLLLIAAIVSMLVMNSSLADGFDALKHAKIGAGPFLMSVEHWVQDGLMAVFFLFVSLELKREFLDGALSNPKHALLPIGAAVGGMVVPAAIYLALAHQGEFIKGWAIPLATDIAFSLGVLSLFGARVPPLLKAFLLALAIVDDLAGVLVIAFAYTDTITPAFLGIAAAMFAAMMLLNRLGVRRLEIYWLLGVLLWAAMLQSGVHATMAGVLTAMAIPLGKSDPHAPLLVAEHALRPVVQFFIMPLYALSAAGIAFHGLSMAEIAHPVSMGVFLGLLLGKPLGILAFCLLFQMAFKTRTGLSWGQMTGVACLAGIGFTMALFIGTLAFGNAPEGEYARIGIIGASLLSAVLGYAILDRTLHKRANGVASSPVSPFLTRD